MITGSLVDRAGAYKAGLHRRAEHHPGGDIVVTSGLGGVYPRDYPIGSVVEITHEESDATLYATVRPFVDIPNLRDVFIITNFEGQGDVVEFEDGQGVGGGGAMKARYKILRCLAYFLEILALYVLQMTPGLVPSVFGVTPLLVIPAALTVAVLEDEVTGLAFGIFAGLLVDFGMGDMLGFHALFFGRCLLPVGDTGHQSGEDHSVYGHVALFLAVPVPLFAAIRLFYLIPGYDIPGRAYLRYYLPRMAYTWIVTPIFYFINRAFVLWIRARDD